jgi:hypothetical protein
VLKRKYPGFLEQVVKDETSASFYEIENGEKQFIREDFPDATALRRGLISRDPAPGGQRCRHKNLTSHGLPADIADFGVLEFRVPGYPAGRESFWKSGRET